MWRTGVVLLTFLLCIQLSAAALRNDVKTLERLRRSPQYCPPHWPPPPYWRHGPPHWQHHHRYQEDQAEAAPETQAAATDEKTAGATNSAQYKAISAGPLNQGGSPSFSPPCTTCRGSIGNTAESNAKSDTGNAIAVAIAKQPK